MAEMQDRDSRSRDGGSRDGGRDGGREGGDPNVPFVKKSFFRRRRTCPFSGADAQVIDYKDPETLRRFMSEKGKIMPSRITCVSAPKQRELAQAIKRARYLALLPYVDNEQ